MVSPTMEKLDKRNFFAGLIIFILGLDTLLSLSFYFNSTGFFLLFIGILLMIHSNEDWREDLSKRLPQELEELFYYPTLPYFQTALVMLLFLGSLFYMDDYIGMLVVMIGIVVTQIPLVSFKKYLKDRTKMLIVMEFQLFLFFSTFLYLHAPDLFVFRFLPEILRTAFFVAIWTVEMIRIYIVNFGRYTVE